MDVKKNLHGTFIFKSVMQYLLFLCVYIYTLQMLTTVYMINQWCVFRTGLTTWSTNGRGGFGKPVLKHILKFWWHRNGPFPLKN